MSENILKGIYEPTIKKDDLIKMSKIFSYFITETLPQAEYEKMIIETDQVRNMIFLEGILQDNQCFINISYDLDMFICEDNFGILQDVKERLDEIIKSKDNTCNGIHAKVEYNIFDKMKWKKHFRLATNDFKNISGWNSPKFQKITFREIPKLEDIKILVLLESQSHTDNMMDKITEAKHKEIYQSWKKIRANLDKLLEKRNEFENILDFIKIPYDPKKVVDFIEKIKDKLVLSQIYDIEYYLISSNIPRLKENYNDSEIKIINDLVHELSKEEKISN